MVLQFNSIIHLILRILKKKSNKQMKTIVIIIKIYKRQQITIQKVKYQSINII
jgi:hypothetical protein